MKKAFLIGFWGVAVAATGCDTSTGDATGGAGGSGTTSATTGSSMSTGTTTGTSTGASMSSTSSGMTAAPTVSFEVNPTTIKAGANTEATVTVTNFTLVPPQATNVDGEGHYHIYLDQQTSYLVAGQTPTITVKIPAGTAPGPHTLRINLSDNKHKALNPPVEDVIDITVE
ncbi:MAG: hypothetical protein U0414_27170 [Polyangiaceae bacterium]